eukprot:gene22175-29238_t
MAVLVALLMAMASLGATNALKDYTSEALLDKVDYLPGWGSIDDFDLFSGYITVSEEAGRALFYAFATAKVKPETAPLVLWNNGGPGCSSLGGGFMSELGPFLPLPGGKQLQSNAHAWNRVVNTVFLESPAFVGFSYSNTSSDKVVGDARTAADSRLFMIGFLKRFPHLKNNDLYLSGESYGGHYIPNLALEIVKGNEAGQGDEDEMINLKGFLVGNAWTDATIDNKGTVDFWWYHALISDATLAGIMNTCDFSKIGPLRATAEDEACDQLCSKASREMGPINIYEIFAGPINIYEIFAGKKTRGKVLSSVLKLVLKLVLSSVQRRPLALKLCPKASWEIGPINIYKIFAGKKTRGKVLSSVLKLVLKLVLSSVQRRPLALKLCPKASWEMRPINIYRIFDDTCIPSRAMSELETFSSLLEGHPAGLSARAALQQMKTQREWKSQGAASTITSSTSSTTTTTSNADRLTNRKLKASLNNGMAKLMHGNENGGGVAEEEHGYDPCVDNEVEVYLNLPEVQK